MTSMDPDRFRWRKSSYSGGSGNDCVEVALLPDGRTAIRDSKNPNGGMVLLTSEEWAAFRTAIDDGSEARP